MKKKYKEYMCTNCNTLFVKKDNNVFYLNGATNEFIACINCDYLDTESVIKKYIEERGDEYKVIELTGLAKILYKL